ncbi:MAG: beta-xylosidase, partial [Chitinophagaceae bacterium]
EDAEGRPVYNWRITDSIFDTYIQRGMKPLAQIGFMPEALSINPQPYQHNWKPGEPYNKIYTGWAYPPKDYAKWGELVYQWVKHCVERYGRREVESWYWEVWNEPNGYWKGTQEEFFKLYDFAADGLKRALPSARIGGPNIAGTSSAGATAFMHAFIKHCLYGKNYATGKTGSPLEALLFHAKGNPKLKDGVVWMNMSPQLRDIEAGIKIAMTYPETKSLPLIVGESDPEGCAACGMATNPSNAYRNGTMYSSYTAASFARKYELAQLYKGNLIGAVSWSFEFEDQPWFYGFRDLATNGVDKPVLNVFRMFGMMKGNLVSAESNRMYPLRNVIDSSIRGSTDIGAIASGDKKSAAIMIWNYHDEDVKGEPEDIIVSVKNLPAKAFVLKEFRIDDQHSNSYETWKKMGSPQNPTREEIKKLEASGMLQSKGSIEKLQTKKGEARLPISLARQGVSLLVLEW